MLIVTGGIVVKCVSLWVIYLAPVLCPLILSYVRLLDLSG